MTGTLYQLLALGAVDRELPIVGLVRSMLTRPTIKDEVFPARSVQLPWMLCPAPSFESIFGLEMLSTLERGSVHEKLTVTGPLFQPNEFASGLLDPPMTGGVRSMLMPNTVSLAKFPAKSMHVPVTD